jgi:hypothetical protein
VIKLYDQGNVCPPGISEAPKEVHPKEYVREHLNAQRQQNQVHDSLLTSLHFQPNVSMIISVALVLSARCCGDTVSSICFMDLRISLWGNHRWEA